MINSGAIMSCSLHPSEAPDTADRFEYVADDLWRILTGAARPASTTPSTSPSAATADRNFALGYFMREHPAPSPRAPTLVETLEFYFQCCSIEVDARSLSVVAAALANGGVNPLTGERVFSARHRTQVLVADVLVRDVRLLPGEFAFTIGLPAKSGVSGAL